MRAVPERGPVRRAGAADVCFSRNGHVETCSLVDPESSLNNRLVVVVGGLDQRVWWVWW